jgi:hypothetical protein
MERDRRRRAEYPGGFEGGMHTAGAGPGPKPGSWLPKIDFETKTNGIKPDVDMSSADAGLPKAVAIGSDIANALAITARPVVDAATLERALQLAKPGEGNTLRHRRCSPAGQRLSLAADESELH